MVKLLSPCRLGTLELANPVVFLPFFTSYADEEGLVTEPLLRHYKRMAASGAGLVVVEASHLRHSAAPFAIHAFAPEHVPGLKKLVEVIHAEGAKAVLQICHPGRFSFFPGCLAPSAVPPFGNPDVMPKAMDEDEMDMVIADFVESTAIAMQAGFDGVELHGGTGYLLASFLSPHTNRRTDRYGGSVENRARFPLRVCKAVREKAGDYPVGYRFMVREFVDGGLSLEDGVASAVLLARELRPAYFSVMSGMYECWAMMAQKKEKSPVGYMLPEAAAVKKALPDVGVIAAGQLLTREICEKALAENMADAIGLGRVLFADCDWLRKVSGKMPEAVRACVQCNVCQKQVSTGRPVFCSRWSKEEKGTNLAGVPEERLRKQPEET